MGVNRPKTGGAHADPGIPFYIEDPLGGSTAGPPLWDLDSAAKLSSEGCVFDPKTAENPCPEAGEGDWSPQNGPKKPSVS